MEARYIVRLDDACATMDRKKWERIEEILDRYSISPIVAVIPSNQDPQMRINPEDELFWDRVRAWQAKGWHIALHGFEHRYVTQSRGIIPMNAYGEFSSRPLEEQKEKILKGLAIFAQEGIETKIWVAPAHNFDHQTLEALRESPIQIISDGIAHEPYRERGFFWIPCQLSSLIPQKSGLWSACYHPNTMGEKEFEDLERFLNSHSHSVLSNLSSLEGLYGHRKRTLKERLYFYAYFLNRRRQQNQTLQKITSRLRRFL